MIISGLQKVTLLDYPGHIACTVFFGNCNLRCPFCHNMELVLHPEKFPKYSIEQIIDFLKDRKGRLDGVAITGGEPLLNADIEELLMPIKELGFPIKLDTNGFFPQMIDKLIEKNLIDYFAMDIKSSFNNYLKVSGIENDIKENDDKLKLVRESISLLMNKAKDYEFRTTCVKGLHSKEDFYEIKDMISGAKRYFLQNYKAAPDMEDLPFKPFTKEELNEFVDIVKDSVKEISIRGVD